eukprot:1398294-Lingulodinium_polyedra.AAC.1
MQPKLPPLRACTLGNCGVPSGTGWRSRGWPRHWGPATGGPNGGRKRPRTANAPPLREGGARVVFAGGAR